ncbi:hypothetical protein C8035_v011233 [Colletotrichum spinosum]|uniref:Uncharacterized protein n=1 Tax=Colletotrichum spinosum TaxID=1347390 RepID=A0A4R8PYG3_9PEZI|nr:hypothetical protein C8035_v011233 [Colletotrichum spinosum]
MLRPAPIRCPPRWWQITRRRKDISNGAGGTAEHGTAEHDTAVHLAHISQRQRGAAAVVTMFFGSRIRTWLVFPPLPLPACHRGLDSMQTDCGGLLTTTLHYKFLWYQSVLIIAPEG